MFIAGRNAKWDSHFGRQENTIVEETVFGVFAKWGELGEACQRETIAVLRPRSMFLKERRSWWIRCVVGTGLGLWKNLGYHTQSLALMV